MSRSPRGWARPGTLLTAVREREWPIARQAVLRRPDLGTTWGPHMMRAAARRAHCRSLGAGPTEHDVHGRVGARPGGQGVAGSNPVVPTRRTKAVPGRSGAAFVAFTSTDALQSIRGQPLMGGRRRQLPTCPDRHERPTARVVMRPTPAVFGALIQYGQTRQCDRPRWQHTSGSAARRATDCAGQRSSTGRHPGRWHVHRSDR